MSFFKRPGPAIAEPIDPEPIVPRETPVVDVDVEPPKVGPDGLITREWTAWEWRDAERRQRVANARSRIDYTGGQTTAMLRAQAARDAAATVVTRLEDQRAELWHETRRTLVERTDSSLGNAAVPFRHDDRPDVEILRETVADLDRKLEPARAVLDRCERALRELVDAADEDLARRRAAIAPSVAPAGEAWQTQESLMQRRFGQPS